MERVEGRPTSTRLHGAISQNAVCHLHTSKLLPLRHRAREREREKCKTKEDREIKREERLYDYATLSGL
jgi:hypothetical protein